MKIMIVLFGVVALVSTDFKDRTGLSKVLQIAIEDFYVKYKLIVTMKHPELRFPMRSGLQPGEGE